MNEKSVEASINNDIINVTMDRSLTEKLRGMKQSCKKYIKQWHLALTALILVFIICIIVTKTTSREESFVYGNKTAAKYVLPEQGLLICEGDVLWNYNIQDNSIKIVKKTDKVIGSFDVHKDLTFWSESSESTIQSESNINEKTEVIFENLRFKVQAIAVDYFTNKLYAIDKIMGTAIVIDLQSKQFGILLTDLKQPQDILLDPSEGMMFILQATESILRSYMDGTSFLTIVQPNTIAITLDYRNKMIYGISNYKTIFRTDYDGNGHNIILEDVNSIISLTISNDHLFWLWPKDEIHNSTLWSCLIKNDTCQNHQAQPIELRNAVSVKSLSHRSVNEVNALNSCSSNKAVCEHLCLLSSKRKAGHSCGCYVGWEVQSKPSRCQAIKEFLLYVTGTTVRSRTLNFDKESFTEVFLPITLELSTDSMDKNIDRLFVEYNARDDMLYFSDIYVIYAVSLKRSSSQQIWIESSFSRIGHLAFDWLSQNLYYDNYYRDFNWGCGSLTEKNVRENYKIFSRNMDYGERCYIKKCNFAMVCDPLEGNIFYINAFEEKCLIYQSTLNGSILHSSVFNNPYLLGIDSAEKRLYSFDSSGEGVLEHFNFDFSDNKTIYLPTANVKNIYIDSQWLYINEEQGISRCNKISGTDCQKLIPRMDINLDEPIRHMQIVNLTIIELADRENPCLKDNGGCEHFCHASPRKTCECSIGQKLERDNAHCG